MKKLLLLITLFSPLTFLSSQTSFVIDQIPGPEASAISDIVYTGGIYYALATHVSPGETRTISGDLLQFDVHGDLIRTYPLGGDGYTYYQIVSIHGDTIELIGNSVTTECNSTLLLSDYVISSETLVHKSQLPLCDSMRPIQRVKLIKGHDDRVFFEGNYGMAFSNQYVERTFIATLNDQHQLEYVFDGLGASQHFSIDFAKKGYLVKSTDHIKFYDQDFNLRKSRNNSLVEYTDDLNNISVPFGNGYILDQVKKTAGAQTGQAIRLLDSNFYVRNLAVISEDEDSALPASLPPYKGMEIIGENTIWTTSNYGSYATSANSTFYSISRLNENLEIQCTHFGGFNKMYRIYGITAFEHDGAVIYGWKAPYNSNPFSEKQDIYAVKVTDNCELTTSLDNPADEKIGITAYPNPTINTITFDVQGFDPATLQLEIFNATGTILFTKKDLSYEIHVSDLPAGQYFYRILQNKEILGTGSWVKK